MPLNDDLRRLGMQLEALKEASMFDAKARAEAAMNTAYRLLNDFDARLRRLEKIRENVEPLK